MRSFLSALFVVALALAGLGVWLHMEQNDTLSALRTEADREALGHSVDLDPPPADLTALEPAPDSDPAPDPDSDPAPDPDPDPAPEQDDAASSLSIVLDGDGPGDGSSQEARDNDSGDENTNDEDAEAVDPDADTATSSRLSDPLPMPMDDSTEDGTRDDTEEAFGDAGIGNGGSEDTDRLPPLSGETQGEETQGDETQGEEASDDSEEAPGQQGENAPDPELASLPEPIESAAPPSLTVDDETEPSTDPDPSPSDQSSADQEIPDQPEAESAEDSGQDAAENPVETPVPDDPPPAAPTPANPAIAIVVMDLGQSSAATESAIQRLPGAVTLAFTPYANTLSRWVPQALAAGHEVLMMVPMEPVSYPRDDPGPQTLLTSLTAETNLGRLDWALDRAEGYVGVVNNMGSRMTASRDSIRPILEDIHNRDLLFLDSRTARNSVVPDLAEDIGLPVAINDRFIDQVAARSEIDDQLAQLESVARQRGYAVGIARSYPVTFERLAAWLPTLEDKDIDLVPISRIANGDSALQAGATQ